MALHSEDLEQFKYLDQEPKQPSSFSARPNADQDNSCDKEQRPQRPRMTSSLASTETIRASAPMNIPNSHENGGGISGSPQEFEQGSYMERYARPRNPSLAFEKDMSFGSGSSTRMNDSISRSIKDRGQGRSMLSELAEERSRQQAGSTSTDSPVDMTRSPQIEGYAGNSLREQPHIGEPHFPLLQKTVDDIAHEARFGRLPQAMSMTSQSTMSPKTEEVRTPRDEESQSPLSPMPISPRIRPGASSYDSTGPRPFRRSASQRWRDGEAAQDFFGRAGSLRKSYKDPSGFKPSSRRETFSSNTTNNSVASSFLKGFSVSSHDGENAAPTAVDAEGQTIGDNYVLGKQIGFGGFSTIREVTQLSEATGEQRKLAAKIVRSNIEGKSEADNEAAQADFDHEVELWRFIKHENILPLESVYKLEEATFCFMPLNTGGTLLDIVSANRAGLGHDLARNYAYQLASALRYLHLDVRVVHRDVKLENCLVDTTKGSPGLMRLCDFGMAEWISTDRTPQRSVGPGDSSSTGFAGGSLEYASPETLRNANFTISSPTASRETFAPAPVTVESNHTSPAVDLWAFGVCVYFMVVGKRPFSNGFRPRLVNSILLGEWDRSLLAEKAGGDEDLIDLVEGCLTMDANRRWDIRTVVECAWFDSERAKHEDSLDERASQWRL